jgi:hypothetical protein
LVQYNLQLIPHNVGASVIDQRAADGYINATAMCRAAGREFKHYNENKTTKAFLSELSSEVGIPTSELVQALSGGNPALQGTWVHPQVAIHLAQWLSPQFAVKVSQWVYDWLSGKGRASAAVVPYHLRRYVANANNVPVGHFSILTELTLSLIAPMEIYGYTLPERLVPDISHGKMFAKFLRDEHGVDTDLMPTYLHRYEDGRVVSAKAYPNRYLAACREHFSQFWLPKKAHAYFAERDPLALSYLDKLLPPPLKSIKR